MAELTALDLNNQIVKMRKTVKSAIVRLTRKSLMSKKRLENKKGTDFELEKNKNKAERLLEEIHALRKLKADTVSKHAILNTKTLNELLQNDCSAEERAMYKLSTEKLLVKTVDKFREQYPKWHQEAPFLLQRLGLQYRKDQEAFDLLKAKRNEKTQTLKNTSKDKKSIKGVVSKQSQDKQQSPLNKIVKKSSKVKSNKDEAVIKRIDLDKDFANDEHPLLPLRLVPVSRQTTSTFFLTGDDAQETTDSMVFSRESDTSMFKGKRKLKRREGKDANQQPLGKLRHPARNAVDKPVLSKPIISPTEETEHPSWKAKRMAKSKQMVASQGKKKTFDDSD